MLPDCQSPRSETSDETLSCCDQPIQTCKFVCMQGNYYPKFNPKAQLIRVNLSQLEAESLLHRGTRHFRYCSCTR